MSEPADLARRVEELEVKIAYQDRMIEDLDRVVQEFAARVGQLEKILSQLEGATAASGLDVGPADDKPPHY